jgi:PEGA domain
MTAPSKWRFLARVSWAAALTVAIVSTSGGAPPRAHAADPVEVEGLIRQAVGFRQKGQDHAALPLFRKAYDLERSPRTAAQLGLCELALGYSVPAEQHLSEALTSVKHLWVEKHREALEEALKNARGAVARVEVSGSPAGAEVFVNGTRVGVLPLMEPVAVSEGLVHVRVKAPGFAEEVKNFKIPGGGHERWSVSLNPAPQSSATAGSSELKSNLLPPAPSPQPGSAPIIADPPDSGASGALVGRAPAPSRSAWRPLRYVAAGAAGVSLITGVVFHAVRERRADDFNRQCFPVVGSECTELESSVDRARNGAIVGYAAAALLGATATYLFFKASAPTSADRQASRSCTASWPMGVACAVRF